jgi:hypothetical protein
MSENTFLKVASIALILGVFAGMLGGVGILLSDSDTTNATTPTIYICAFLPLLIIIITTRKKQKNFIILKKLKKSKIRKSKGEKSEMLELAKRFIDKDCIIYSFDGSQQYGTIKEVTDNAILIEEKDELIAVNLEFVSKIKEFPKNKNGKRKSVVF